jgi:hypothetical protein
VSDQAGVHLLVYAGTMKGAKAAGWTAKCGAFLPFRKGPLRPAAGSPWASGWGGPSGEVTCPDCRREGAARLSL